MHGLGWIAGLGRTGALAFGLVAVAGAAASAETTGSGTLAIPTVTEAPALDPHADPAAWKDAATVTLPWDVQHARPSTEKTAAHVSTDGTNLYVRFDVEQREALLAQQRTNDVGDGTDDEVWIDLWPNGNAGFSYQFAATSNGTHYQYSSENNDAGTFIYTTTFGFAASARKVGAYYEPVDGFIQHADIAGYALFENKIFLFDAKSWLNSIQFATSIDRYHGTTGGLNQTDNVVQLDVLTRHRIDVDATIGSSYLRLNSGVFTPISQNGVAVTWHSPLLRCRERHLKER